MDACDNSGNCITNETFTFRTIAENTGATAVSEDFNHCLLTDSNVNWTFTDPEGDSTAIIGADYETLEIHVPAGNAHDPVGTNTSARLMQNASNSPNFVLETKFLSVPVDRFQVQGMIVEQDANDYVRFDMFYTGSVMKAYVSTFVGGVETNRVNKTVPDETRYILINRINGTDWELHHSIDGNSWKPVVQFSHNMNVNSVGVYAGNAPSGANQPPEFTAVVDYLLDWDTPFVGGEDPESLAIPVTIDGGGTVNKSIECGKPVTLTAVPNSGHRFTHWTGAVAGSTNPVILTDWAKSDSVTAYFAEGEYLVTINSTSIDHLGQTDSPNAGGVVEASKEAYNGGETVTLTAVAEPGWSVKSWSGAGLSGNNRAVSFVISQDETVNIIFEQDKYSYNLTQEGPGNVLISSDGVARGYFIYGDEVTLTAVETNSDFKFRYWSGAINSTSNPVTFALMGEFDVAVLFSDKVEIFLPLIQR